MWQLYELASGLHFDVATVDDLRAAMATTRRTADGEPIITLTDDASGSTVDVIVRETAG